MSEECAACKGQGIGRAEYDPLSGVVDHPLCRLCAGSGIRVSDRDAAVAMAAYQCAPGNNPLDCMRAALAADRVATRRADARSTGDAAESIHRLRAVHGEFLTACADPFVHDRLTYARRVVDAVPDALTAYIDQRALNEETRADLLECRAELGRLRAESAAMRAAGRGARLRHLQGRRLR